MSEIFLIYIKIHLELYCKYSSVKITGYADRAAMHIHDLFCNGKT